MAKSKENNKRKSKQMTIPIAVVAGFSIPAAKAWEGFKGSGISGAVAMLSRGFTGYAPWAGTWDYRDLKMGLLPVIVGMAVHKVASALGINRALASTGIPLVRI